MSKVVHSIHFPISARSFVEPFVCHLNQNGFETEIWLENSVRHSAVIQQLNVPIKLIPSDFVVNPFIFYRKLFNFRSNLRASKPKILHAHQSRASVIPLLAAYLEKVPIRIYHNHGLPYLGYHGILRWLLQQIEILNIRLSTHVLFVSNSNLLEAREDNILPNQKGSVIANGSAVGIDPSKFKFCDEFIKQAKRKFGVSHANFVLAYVGRAVERKGFHLLLRAWEKSGLGLSNNYLLIAGCTASDCEKALGHSVAGVKGLGYIDDLREFYAACDALTLPSKHEGFPYSLLEAAASGKPLIGTDIPGIRCAIQHNSTGLLVSLNDEDDLVVAFLRFASDPLLRSRLGENARQRVKEEFSQTIVLAGLLNFYQQILPHSMETLNSISPSIEEQVAGVLSLHAPPPPTQSYTSSQ
jgi:N,N'-diacetylbacillosaminyl-diphospho-undecaprenol alpha-1,3-N-acetylgalactosaminyltransferase